MAVQGPRDVMHPGPPITQVLQAQAQAQATPDKLPAPRSHSDALPVLHYLETPPTTPQTPAPTAPLPPPPPFSSSSSSSKQKQQQQQQQQRPRKSSLQLPPGSGTMSPSTNVITKIACARCKQKKIKCDGMQPSCSACNRAQVSCTVPDIISQAGLARGHVETLENRVSELQSLIDTKTRELKDLQTRNNRSLSSSHFSISSPVTSNPFTPRKLSSATSLFQSSLERTPDLSRLQHLQADISLARLLIHTLHLKDHRPCIAKLSYLVANERSTAFESIEAADKLPPKSIGNILYASYLENEQMCFPFLSRHDIIRLYREIYSAPNQIHHLNLQDYFCLYMIFAIACLSHPPGIEDPQADALRFYKAALVCRERLPQTSKVTAVQNILLLCLFSLHAKVSQDAWRLSRRALHISIEGEFHLSRRSKNRSSEGETRLDRIKRRVFWCAYCLNRMTSNLIYDRPPSIPEASIDVEMPSEFELNINNMESLTLSLLPCLVNIYGLSTSAFTSFNSLGPPPGDTVSQLQYHMVQLSESSNRLLEILKTGFPERLHGESLKDLDWVPFYITLSFNTHAMLMFHWAMTSIAAHSDGVPTQMQTLTINHCIETINFIGFHTSKFGHLRIAFIIMLRSLIILLSALLAKVDHQLTVVPTDGDSAVSPRDLNNALFLGIEFLRDAGEMQGQSCEFLPALVLAFRYAVFEREFGPTSNLKYFTRREEEYIGIKHRVDNNYPGVLKLATDMVLDALPFGLGLKNLEDMTDADIPPSEVFSKFGSGGAEVEELSKQVGWRLKVQYGVGDVESSLQAFQSRMGIDRQMEGGNPGFGVGNGGANLKDWMDVDPMPCEAIPGFETWSRAPKMDVDFSGFESNIVMFD